MPAADYQLFIVDMRAVTQYHNTSSVLGFLHSFYVAQSDQRTSVDADEVFVKLVGERRQ
jgi:hypothetical protein